jgi:hypothetical protein
MTSRAMPDAAETGPPRFDAWMPQNDDFALDVRVQQNEDFALDDRVHQN